MGPLSGFLEKETFLWGTGMCGSFDSTKEKPPQCALDRDETSQSRDSVF